MSRCLISFGANIGQPAETIRQAAEQLQLLLSSNLLGFRLSRLFRTPAVGGPAGQPPFVNAVAALELQHCSAWDVWHTVRRIEQTLGRVRQERWEARRIDLDVLLFDDLRIWTQHFKLPHPRMVMRRFILEPAMDVAKLWREPVSGMTIGQLTDSLRHGMASIALIADDPNRAQTLLENAAAKSQAAWLVPTLDCPGPIQGQRPGQLEPLPDSLRVQTPILTRWLGIVSSDALRLLGNHSHHIHASKRATVPNEHSSEGASLHPRPKLVVVLAGPLARAGAAWEDVQRPLARWLGLCPRAADTASAWPLAGPRYLLSTDDLSWAEHEIVAALEAMDCPIEPLES